MPVISIASRVRGLVGSALEEVMAPDDVVEIHVGMDVIPKECDDETSGDACPDCGSHGYISAVSIFMSLWCPEIESHSSVHWLTPIAFTYDEDSFKELVLDSWTNLTFKRQAAGLDEGLLSTTDGPSGSPQKP